jgi:hypothetical protein
MITRRWLQNLNNQLERNNMIWQTLFYAFGTIFFAGLILFIIGSTVFAMIMAKRANQWAQQVESQINDTKQNISAKLRRPAISVLLTLLPLIPVIMQVLKRVSRGHRDY